MAQEPDSQSQYGAGYGGYTPPPRPSDPYSTSQQGYQQQPDGSSQQQQQFSYGQQQQQQYGSYQPPSSATQGTSASDPTTTGMNGRTAALVSYVLWWFTGIIFFLIERKNRFVRFHAAQSLLFFGSVSIVLTILHLLSIIPILGFLLSLPLAFISTIVIILAIAVWLFMMFQAYRGIYFRLPFFSGYAESLVDRFTSKKRKRSV